MDERRRRASPVVSSRPRLFSFGPPDGLFFFTTFRDHLDLSPLGVPSRENERLAEAPSARGAGTASPLTAQGRARGMASTSAAPAAVATESRPPIDRLIAGGAAGARRIDAFGESDRDGTRNVSVAVF